MARWIPRKQFLKLSPSAKNRQVKSYNKVLSKKKSSYKKKTIYKAKKRKNHFDRYEELMGKTYSQEKEEKVYNQMRKEGYSNDEFGSASGAW